MITRTTLSAVRALLYLAQNSAEGTLSPRRIAEALDESPTYMAKVTRALVRAGILRADKGVKGGVSFGRRPEQIELLAIVEACQGTIMGNFCPHEADVSEACSYHRAALELHEAIVGVLSRWTLAHLMEKPEGTPEDRGFPCLMAGVAGGRITVPNSPAEVG